ncbi:hypothetical protein [Nocardia sp. NPDC047038]|uniref:hypothetical protein n=1 Tax=Nocardia sp. NPDC047038 TaxID=3154338 RepID=UPI0033C10D88
MSMRQPRNADQRSHCGRDDHRPQATKVAATTPRHTVRRPRPACVADADSGMDAATASDCGGVIVGGERACRGRR